MFKTPNEAEKYIKKIIRSGDFKDCVHLWTREGDDYISKPWQPYCTTDNFERCNRNLFPYRCPDPCDYFEDKTKAERTEQKAKRRSPEENGGEDSGRQSGKYLPHSLRLSSGFSRCHGKVKP